MRKISTAMLLIATFAGITSPALPAQDLDEKCGAQQAINSWTDDCLEWKRRRDRDQAERDKVDNEARAAYWKRQREQEATNAQEAEQREAASIKKDEVEGYKYITFEDFALDAAKMKGVKVSVRGLYIDSGERLLRDPLSALRWVSNGEAVRGANIPLLTERASRDARATFLRCANAATPLSCGMVVRGHVETLVLRSRLGIERVEVGIAVESIRP